MAVTPVAEVLPARALHNSGEASSHGVVDGVSFASAVVAAPTIRVPVMVELVVDVLAGTLEDLSTSVVGLLQPHMSVQTVQEQLLIIEIPNIKVTSLGGNQALISSPINGFLKESLLVIRDWWLSWFKGLTRWSEES